MIRVEYDAKYPQERRLTISYEGSKQGAVGVVNSAMRKAFGWREGQETRVINHIVVENIQGREGEFAADRVAKIARESGLTLARRSPRWLTHGTSGMTHFGKNTPALRFSIIADKVPTSIRDGGIVIGTVYQYIKDKVDRTYYMESLGYKVTVVPPEDQKPTQWQPPRPYVDRAKGGCFNCGQLGHHSRTCRRNPHMPRCNICHRPGHWEEGCLLHERRAQMPLDTPTRC